MALQEHGACVRRVTFENSHIALTGLLCRPKLAVTPYGSVEHVMCRIWGWPCTG